LGFTGLNFISGVSEGFFFEKVGKKKNSLKNFFGDDLVFFSQKGGKKGGRRGKGRGPLGGGGLREKGGQKGKIPGRFFDIWGGGEGGGGQNYFCPGPGGAK